MIIAVTMQGVPTRYVQALPGENWHAAFQRAAFSVYRSEYTPLPAFREMLDNLRWEEIR